MKLSREQQLLGLGFEQDFELECFFKSDYGKIWYLHFSQIFDYDKLDWACFYVELKIDISEAKKIHKSILLYEDGYKSAEKEFKKKIRDCYNKYNSWLKEETSSKLARSPNFKRETELRAKVEVLQQLLNEKPKH